MTDNNQDRSQDEGQQGIDRETEKRNRENETGQQSGKSPGDEDRESSAFGQPGQSAGGETGGQSATGEGFVGSGQDNSSDYLTKGEENQDFAPEGQSAQDTSAGRSDIETGQPQDRDPSLDEDPDSDR